MPNLDFLLEDTKNTELVPQLGALREAKKYTQRELSLLVGVTEATIANWERGRSGLEWFERIHKLCSALDCEPKDLFERRLKPGATEEKSLPSYDELYALYKVVVEEIKNSDSSSATESRKLLTEIIQQLKRAKHSTTVSAPQKTVVPSEQTPPVDPKPAPTEERAPA